MPKARPGQLHAALWQYALHLRKCQATQRQHNAHICKQFQLAVQPERAALHFKRQRLGSRRSAARNGRQVGALQLKPIPALAGMRLASVAAAMQCAWDRFIKNTHEVLSPLNKLTAHALIARYEFLDTERLVRRTTFANGITAVVNGSAHSHLARSATGGDVILPPFGFLVEAESFAAIHALSWGGRLYSDPVLFTLRSLDGESLGRSRQVRVFHWFGESELSWRGGGVDVRRERILGD